MTTERLMGPVVGYRAWRLDGYSLVPLVAKDAPWHVGDNKAECRASQFRVTFRHHHGAPAKRCSCGLYAYHSAETLKMRVSNVDAGTVYGVVAAWGHMEIHRHGFRAQFGRPVALSYSDRTPVEVRMRHAAIASELGLPYVPLDELAQEGTKHGSPVPRGQRPRWEWLDLFIALVIAVVALLGVLAGYDALNQSPLDLIGVALSLACVSACVVVWRRHHHE